MQNVGGVDVPGKGISGCTWVYNVLESLENLVGEILDVLITENILRVDDFVEISLHKIHHYVEVFERDIGRTRCLNLLVEMCFNLLWLPSQQRCTHFRVENGEEA